MNRCSRCILRDDSPGILLNSENICNACIAWDKLSPRLTDFDTLKKNFVSRLDETRGKYEFDAVAGLSGGKDGAYVLYALKEIYGLEVLALTFDLGFMPNDFALENAVRLTEKLGVKHEIVSLPEELVKKIFRAYLGKATHTSPCHLCTSILGLSMGYKFALERKIPKIVTGLDRGQLLNKLHLSHARKRVLDNIGPHKGVADLKKIRQIISFLKLYFRWLGLDSEEMKMLLPDKAHLPEEVPELMMFFLHHPHDEEKIKRFLEKKLGWLRPENDMPRGHYDCELKDMAAAASCRLGLGERLEYELSVDIREGKIRREEAIERLLADRRQIASLSRPFQSVETWLDMSEEDFGRKVGRLSKIAPRYANFSNALLKRTGFGGYMEKLLFLIRPH